ncbi:TerB N-terminal domain-containing protein [Jiangella mangrovi]|uniref:Tellurite resistance protein n=1 Tax=Jiangella mangrovi TaxID=1524084 RepID=A0A7W9GTL9_9ACTN|nr:tellurite resistance protein [Jiangella mangrovi]
MAGYTLPGGMLYIGHGLRSPRGDVEPAQIDPTLKVAVRNVDTFGATMGYWPSYHKISPEARAGYLIWLAGGRRDPHAYIGFVFLFFYGLERRALVDIPADERLKIELPLLRAEVQRLLGIYGGNNSFRGYATKFLDVLDLQLAQGGSNAASPPPLDPERHWVPPLSLMAEVGRLASAGRPVPAEWALAWAWYHPEIHLRTSATRCTKEFTALFTSRYRAAHGDGIRVRPGKSRIQFDYYAASAGLGSAQVSMDAPDVFAQAAPRKHLESLVESVSADLDAYSRFLGRNPSGGSSLAAAALLPDDLRGAQSPEVVALIQWGTRLAESGIATTGADVLSRWPSKASDRLAKPETVALARLLGRHGLGIEPDVRLGGPAILAAAKVILFETGGEAPPQSATPAYASAATLLHLATAVASADGHVSPSEQQHLVDHLERALELTAGERLRLQAHLRWLTAAGVKLTGLSKRVEALSQPQRTSVADLLVTVAAADGAISPEEITSLTKIFKLLGLDPADVHSSLHAHLAGGRQPPASRPVTVREAGAPDPGYPVASPGRVGADAPSAAFSLDAEAIQAKFAETAAVGALLADIFSDDEPVHTMALSPEVAGGPTSAGAPGDSAAAPIPGLDAAHSGFLRTVLTRSSWSRAEIEELAEEGHLMPDGVLDTINEFALDIAGEPLLEEDQLDMFTVNDYARQELQ